MLEAEGFSYFFYYFTAWEVPTLWSCGYSLSNSIVESKNRERKT